MSLSSPSSATCSSDSGDTALAHNAASASASATASSPCGPGDAAGDGSGERGDGDGHAEPEEPAATEARPTLLGLRYPTPRCQTKLLPLPSSGMECLTFAARALPPPGFFASKTCISALTRSSSSQTLTWQAARRPSCASSPPAPPSAPPSVPLSSVAGGDGGGPSARSCARQRSNSCCKACTLSLPSSHKLTFTLFFTRLAVLANWRVLLLST
mmetsp:Transcript_29560/g.97909  ORF Transcript_29560/g.97909 Transcript_29560/m.97909 type:complete len:214 (-) Transcript_29560:1261-1902(-)